jgi:hypothetical protein
VFSLLDLREKIFFDLEEIKDAIDADKFELARTWIYYLEEDLEKLEDAT